MIELRLTEHEVVLLAGLVGATAGDNLNMLYYDLLDILSKIEPSGDLEKLSGLMTEEIAGILRGKQINEDDIYDNAVEYLSKVRGW